MLLEQVGEFRHLLLQCGDLRQQGAKPLGQGQQRGGQGWLLVGPRSRQLLGEGSQAALMQALARLQVLTAHPFFAAIVGMAKPRELSLRQPAAQRFGIDAEATTRVGQREEGHGTTPFVWCVQQEREGT